jgi:hypothetical protein
LFIQDPDFCPSRIPNPKTATKERGEKKVVVLPFCSHKYHKIEHYFIFELVKKKLWANLQRIIELFTQKMVFKLSKIWVWDPRFGIWDPRSGILKKPIPDPGVKKAPDPGSGSAILLVNEIKAIPDTSGIPVILDPLGNNAFRYEHAGGTHALPFKDGKVR